MYLYPRRPSGDRAVVSVQVVLNVLGDQVPAALRSGGDDLTHPLSSGTQEYDTDQTLWPVNKAVPKIEAQAQTSGE